MSPTLRHLPLPYTWWSWPVTNYQPPNAGATWACALLVLPGHWCRVPGPRGQGCEGRVAIPQAAGEKEHSGIKKFWGNSPVSGSWQQ